jgi:hypothetical protein
MKARRNAAAPSKVSPTHPSGLGISPPRKKEKMQIALDEFLKTKGQKKCSG